MDLHALLSVKRIFLFVGLFLSPTLHAQIASIPFELKKNGHIIFEIQLNDHPDKLEFLLDTGASGELLAKHTAEKLGISTSQGQKIEATGVSGSTSLDVIHNQRLNLGKGISLRLRNLVIADNPTDGLLGATIFRKYVCLINYDNQQLELYESIDDLDKTGFTEIPFTFDQQIPIPQLTMDFTLSNGESFSERVFYDIGAGITFMFNTPFATKQNVLKKSKAIKTLEVEGGLTQTKVTHEKVMLSKLALGGHTLDSVVVRVTNSKKGLLSFENYAGVIGSQIAKRFNTIIDYKNKVLYIKPNQLYK
jgi:predicted aspartyl protease